MFGEQGQLTILLVRSEDQDKVVSLMMPRRTMEPEYPFSCSYIFFSIRYMNGCCYKLLLAFAYASYIPHTYTHKMTFIHSINFKRDNAVALLFVFVDMANLHIFEEPCSDKGQLLPIAYR